MPPEKSGAAVLREACGPSKPCVWRAGSLQKLCKGFQRPDGTRALSGEAGMGKEQRGGQVCSLSTPGPG